MPEPPTRSYSRITTVCSKLIRQTSAWRKASTMIGSLITLAASCVSSAAVAMIPCEAQPHGTRPAAHRAVPSTSSASTVIAGNVLQVMTPPRPMRSVSA